MNIRNNKNCKITINDKKVDMGEDIEEKARKVINIINHKEWEYRAEYSCEPKYVKVPYWVLHTFREYKNIIGYRTYLKIKKRKDGRYLINNLIVCETLSIDKIKDIEVF